MAFPRCVLVRRYLCSRALTGCYRSRSCLGVRRDECIDNKVTLLLILNLRSFCLTIFGMLGVLLAFAATYFFHFTVLEYKSLTVLDFLSLFLIVGIAADDMRLGRIACLFPVSWCCGFAATASNFVQVLDPSRSALSRLILCHTFRLAPAVLGPRAGPRECMKWAYKQAGEAMLARAPAHRLTH